MERERSEQADSAAHALEIRRAWLQDDARALLKALRLLAPRCQYGSRELCRIVGVSPRHLQRIFSRAIGTAPQQWLNEQRLLAAKELLSGERSVKEVAFELGFRTVSQLSRDFKDRFGVTPTGMMAAHSKSLATRHIEDDRAHRGRSGR